MKPEPLYTCTRGRTTLRAFAKLLKIGDQAPYFSLTGERLEGCVLRRCGMIHSDLLAEWPELQTLADLHLADIDGVPMHCHDNGWYWLCGARGGLGARYHGSNDGRHDPDDCIDNLARHYRITRDSAKTLAESVSSFAELEAWAESQRPRWKSEAEACIESFNLKIINR